MSEVGEQEEFRGEEDEVSEESEEDATLEVEVVDGRQMRLMERESLANRSALNGNRTGKAKKGEKRGQEVRDDDLEERDDVEGGDSDETVRYFTGH